MGLLDDGGGPNYTLREEIWIHAPRGISRDGWPASVPTKPHQLIIKLGHLVFFFNPPRQFQQKQSFRCFRLNRISIKKRGGSIIKAPLY